MGMNYSLPLHCKAVLHARNENEESNIEPTRSFKLIKANSSRTADLRSRREIQF